MALVIAPQPWLIFLDDNGFFVPSGQLAIYEAGTSTPAFTYADITGTPHPFPITLDSAGRVPGGLYLTPGYSYKFVLHAPRIVLNLSGAIIKTQDNVMVPTGGGETPPAPGTLDILGTLGNAALAGVPMYMSDGEAGLTPGLWYYANATNEYSSTQPPIAFTALGGNVGDIVPLRAAGLMQRNALLPPLVPGGDYYVNTSDATITLTAPLFARFLGRAQTTELLLVNSNPAVTSGVQRTTRINVPGAPYNIQWPATAGVPNGALTTDGLGNLAWSVSGGGSLPTAALGQVLISQGVGVGPIFSHTPILEGATPSVAIRNLSGPDGFRSWIIGTEIWDGAANLVFRPTANNGAPYSGRFSVNVFSASFHSTGHGAVDGKLSAVQQVITDRFVEILAGPLASMAVPDRGIGALANISDSATVEMGAVIVGGGAFNVLGRYDGTNWRVVAGVGVGATPAPHRLTHETGGADALQNLSAGILTSGQVPDARLSVNVLQHPAGYPGGTVNFLRADGTFTMPTGLAPAPHATTHNTGGSDPITALAATVLTTGILPDARFPAVLPAVSGANLTNLDANDLATGTVPNARFPATLPVASAINLTNVNAGALVGTVPDGNLSSNVPLKNAANIFTLTQTAPNLQLTQASFPFVGLNATGEPVDQRSFQAVVVARVLTLRPVNDAFTTAGPGIELNRSGFINGPGQVRVSVARVAALNVSSATLEVINFDAEVFDVGPCHATGGAALIVPAGGGGTYMVIGVVSYAPAVGGARMARIRKNGAGEEAVAFIASAGGGVNTTASAQAILELVAGDALELVAFQDSGSPLSVAGSKFSWIKIW